MRYAITSDGTGLGTIITRKDGSGGPPQKVTDVTSLHLQVDADGVGIITLVKPDGSVVTSELHGSGIEGLAIEFDATDVPADQSTLDTGRYDLDGAGAILAAFPHPYVYEVTLVDRADVNMRRPTLRQMMAGEIGLVIADALNRAAGVFGHGDVQITTVISRPFPKAPKA